MNKKEEKALQNFRIVSIFYFNQDIPFGAVQRFNEIMNWYFPSRGCDWSNLQTQKESRIMIKMQTFGTKMILHMAAADIS